MTWSVYRAARQEALWQYKPSTSWETFTSCQRNKIKKKAPKGISEETERGSFRLRLRKDTTDGGTEKPSSGTAWPAWDILGFKGRNVNEGWLSDKARGAGPSGLSTSVCHQTKVSEQRVPESVTLLYQGWYIVHSQGLSAGAKGCFPLISSNCRLTWTCFDPGYSVTVRDATTWQSCALQSQETFNACRMETRVFDCVFISFSRRVWLCDGRTADSGGVGSQSRCQDYEEWVDSRSTQQSPQWVPSSFGGTQAFLIGCPLATKLSGIGGRGGLSFWSENRRDDSACWNHWQEKSTPNKPSRQNKDNCITSPYLRGKKWIFMDWEQVSVCVLIHSLINSGASEIKVCFLPWRRLYELYKTTLSHRCTLLSLVAICTRSEMEDFLREAACMKEFDHANVMRLLGESRFSDMSHIVGFLFPGAEVEKCFRWK